ncbi:MAG: (2Fe-2S)-binding protein [Tahibacter sp.]
MYVCICHGITDKVIREAASAGVGSLAELTMRTGCASGCGSCAEFAEQLLRDSQPRKTVRFPVPLAVAA